MRKSRRYTPIMLKRPIAVLIVALLGVFALGLWLGHIVQRFSSLFPSPTRYNTATVIQQIKTVSELVTVQYVIERVVIMEDVKWLPVLGESRVLLLAHGIVKGGIDLGKLEQGDIRISGKKISLKLPPSQIMEAYLDEKQCKVIERTTGLLRTFDKDLEQNARITAVDDIRRAARSSGILKEADSRARAQLSLLFHQLGFEEVEFR
jgi:hypothetical protein